MTPIKWISNHLQASNVPKGGRKNKNKNQKTHTKQKYVVPYSGICVTMIIEISIICSEYNQPYRRLTSCLFTLERLIRNYSI